MHIIYYIYFYSLRFSLEFMGITEIQEMKRWQKKKEKMLFALRRSCLPYCGLEKKKGDYTLTTGLFNTFER